MLGIWIFIQRRAIFLSLFFFNLTILLLFYYYELSRGPESFPAFIWINVPSWFLIAPLLFLHVQAVMEVEKKINYFLTSLHFLIPLIVLISMIPFYLKPGHEKLLIYNSFYNQNQIIDHVQIIYLTQMGLYTLLGIRSIKRKIKYLQNITAISIISDIKLSVRLFLLLAVYIVIALIISVLVAFIFKDYISYYSLAFSVLSIGVLLANVYFLKDSREVYKSISLNSGNNSSFSFHSEKELKYKSSTLTEENMAAITSRLIALMQQDKIYLQKELNLQRMSELSNFPAHHISQSLNLHLKKSFFEFVNEFRVKEVQRRLLQGDHHTMTLSGLAAESGFKSESSFYRIFKELTGKTPKRFLEY